MKFNCLQVETTMPLLLLLPFLLSFVAAACTNHTVGVCQFMFRQQNCTFLACTIPANNATPSSKLHFRWSYCVSQCCSAPSNPSTPRTMEWLINSCTLQADESLLPVIVGFSVGIPLFLLLLSCLYCSRCRKEAIMPAQSIIESLSKWNDSTFHSNSQPKSEAIIVISDEEEGNKMDTSCSICLENNTTCRTLCGHSFHGSCLLQWLLRHSSCPQCRARPVSRLKIICRQCKRKSLVDWESLDDRSVCTLCKSLH